MAFNCPFESRDYNAPCHSKAYKQWQNKVICEDCYYRLMDGEDPEQLKWPPKEDIPAWVVLLADDLTMSMQDGQFREPVEGTITETLKQMQINRGIVHRLIKGGVGENPKLECIYGTL